MAQTTEQPMPSTLDEPVAETLLRDLKAIGRKVLIVGVPFIGGEQELRDWDLWGPLVLCLILAMTLGGAAGEDQSGLVFMAVFMCIFVGSAVVTLNAKFLGARLSFFQIVCVMGYCTAPMCLAALVFLFVKHWLATLLIALATFAWSTFACLRFFHGCVQPERQALVVYPLGLFYAFLAWMVAVGV